MLQGKEARDHLESDAVGLDCLVPMVATEKLVVHNVDLNVLGYLIGYFYERD